MLSASFITTAVEKYSLSPEQTAAAKLHDALSRLATATGLYMATPPAGEVAAKLIGAGTVSAVAAAIPVIPGIPSAVKTALMLGPLALALAPDAQKQQLVNLLRAHAELIATAIDVYLATRTPAAPPAMPDTTTTPIVSTASTVSTSFVPPKKPGAGWITAAVTGYKAGSVALRNVKRGVYSVYSPIAGLGMHYPASVSGLGIADAYGNCTFGDCGSLGEAPAGMMKVAELPTPPPGVPVVGEEDDTPWYKKPLFLAAAGIATIGLGYLALRKR